MRETLPSICFVALTISLLADLGIPVKEIMERVRQCGEIITLKVYFYVMSTINNDISEKLNKIIFLYKFL